MAIERINDSQAWTGFLKAASAARARSAGFTAAAAPAAGQPETARVFTMPAGKTAGINYASSTTADRPVRVLGTRFDAYA